MEGGRGGGKNEAKEVISSRKAAKGKEFIQTNICDISSLHARFPIPLALGVPNAKVGPTKTARSEGIFEGSILNRTFTDYKKTLWTVVTFFYEI